MADIAPRAEAAGAPFAGWSYAGAIAVSLLGAAVYAAFAAGLFAPQGTTLFGQYIYNYYFLSILEGRLDIPARVASLEGHFDPEGRAFIYHGLAPILTRILAWPFVDLKALPLAAPSVWLWATLGSAVYYISALALLRRFGPTEPGRQQLLVLGLGALVWFAGPGLVVSANPTLYVEAIAISFFCSAVWIAAALRVIFLGAPPAAVLIIMALAAGVTVHARVPMAVGLYAGTCLMIALHLWQTGMRQLIRPALALAILFLFGAGLLAMNMLRFGGPLQFSGSNVEGAAAITYGFAFWGVNPPGANQLDAFLREGTFNLKRVGPNLFIYVFDLPKTVLSEQIMDLYRSWTVERGAIRVAAPRMGMLWLWAPWVLLPLLALFIRPAARADGGPRPVWLGLLPLLIGTAIAVLLMLSYGTVSFRYRVDLWPLLAAFGFLALPRLLAALGAEAGLPRLVQLGFAGVLGLSMLLSIATAISFSNQAAETGIFSFWDAETCARMVQEKGFAAAEVPRICSL